MADTQVQGLRILGATEKTQGAIQNGSFSTPEPELVQVPDT